MIYFKPDIEIHHFSDLSADVLVKNNIKTIFSDLDSTLAIHDQPGDKELEGWVKMLKENDITLIIASNNNQDRVDAFVKPYNITGFGKCKKPLTSVLEQKMKQLGIQKQTSLFLGDQLLTDVWCGKRLNIKTALVKPLGREHEPWNITLKRQIEKLIRLRW
ncbi:YqeG family HAD IIIA-type phosphatase [Desertibacillus haloalkaliphilus]|uniref:YqeG family HAD IIIA-type phosphatase n=1 Tax=Desertibacillus haloalkaliphilus TaxID=1328930 RepID=UPI001C2566AC|nr:HAD-IIIA family hydrolase [Desertibacillus haloalkaliphilus]MBU8907531.1 HAD-IIIA family hydrolase [Desertibacillus haloalkaliphilus]